MSGYKSRYDSVPNYKKLDIIWLWEQQISGRKNFDSCDFSHTLSPNMLSVFDPILDKSGTAGFLKRIKDHFELCGPQENDDGTTSMYQHSSRVKSPGSIDHDHAKTLVRRHLKTLKTVIDESGDWEADSKILEDIPIIWKDDADDFHNLDFEDRADLENGGPLDFYFYDSWHDYGRPKANAPAHILYPLREATYMLAASYDLQRYLMQDFYIEDYDLDAFYELTWKLKCLFYFDDKACYVTRQKP